jgi:hypothetical protein
VSLIHEALRKARHEAARDGDPGVVYPGGLTGRRSRRPLAVGFAAGAAVSIAAALLVFGVTGWSGRRATAVPTATPQRLEPESTRPQPRIVDRDAENAPTTDPGPGPEAPVEQAATSPPAGPISPPAPAVAGETVTPRGERSDDSRRLAFETPTPAAPAGQREYVAEAELGHTTLSLDYIVFRPEDPFAQINGLDVRVGGTIEGFTVEEITAQSVLLRDRQGPLLLRAE